MRVLFVLDGVVQQGLSKDDICSGTSGKWKTGTLKIVPGVSSREKGKTLKQEELPCRGTARGLVWWLEMLKQGGSLRQLKPDHRELLRPTEVHEEGWLDVTRLWKHDSGYCVENRLWWSKGVSRETILETMEKKAGEKCQWLDQWAMVVFKKRVGSRYTLKVKQKVERNKTAKFVSWANGKRELVFTETKKLGRQRQLTDFVGSREVRGDQEFHAWHICNFYGIYEGTENRKLYAWFWSLQMRYTQERNHQRLPFSWASTK